MLSLVFKSVFRLFQTNLFRLPLFHRMSKLFFTFRLERLAIDFWATVTSAVSIFLNLSHATYLNIRVHIIFLFKIICGSLLKVKVEVWKFEIFYVSCEKFTSSGNFPCEISWGVNAMNWNEEWKKEVIYIWT